MNARGLEGMADGVMLLTILLVATGVVSLPPAPPDGTGDVLSYAADTANALLRTTMDGLVYDVEGEQVLLPAGTPVEDFLRVQVRIRTLRPASDFSESNDRIRNLAGALVRPGWGVAIVGGTEHAAELVHIGPPLPAEYASSPRTYPPLASGEPDATLVVAVFDLQ